MWTLLSTCMWIYNRTINAHHPCSISVYPSYVNGFDLWLMGFKINRVLLLLSICNPHLIRIHERVGCIIQSQCKFDICLWSHWLFTHYLEKKYSLPNHRQHFCKIRLDIIVMETITGSPLFSLSVLVTEAWNIGLGTNHHIVSVDYVKINSWCKFGECSNHR